MFRFYLFIEEEYQQFGELKVVSYNYFVAVDVVGVKKSIHQAYMNYELQPALFLLFLPD